jgi:hypothetical protein
MEGLVNQAFSQIDNLTEDVAAGHYDLLGPDSQIIRPQDWEDVIEPGMQITMAMWPKIRRSDMHWDDGSSNLTVGPMHKRKVPSVASDQESERLEGSEEDLPKDFDIVSEQPSSAGKTRIFIPGLPGGRRRCGQSPFHAASWRNSYSLQTIVYLAAEFAYLTSKIHSVGVRPAFVREEPVISYQET